MIIFKTIMYDNQVNLCCFSPVSVFEILQKNVMLLLRLLYKKTVKISQQKRREPQNKIQNHKLLKLINSN